ncbi:MAG: GAF domain-containing protein [Halobacteriales archaeon]
MAGVGVLCVDPDDGDRAETVEGLRSALADLDPVFETAASIEAAERAVESGGIDCVITEHDLPDGTGLDLVARVRPRNPDAGYVLFTGADPDDIDTAEFGGTITEYLDKDAPHARERLADLVRTTVTGMVQTSYPLPQDESERVDALEAYDLDSEELRTSLDRITDLATRHFDVHSASINIIAEHTQEFFACQGRAVSWEPTSREDSICTFTILEDDGVMTVADVREDPRFETNDDLEEMGIRSYMGADLTTPSGLAIGTLCVYDDEPRAFTPSDREYLRRLADLAMDLIDVHHRLENGAGREGAP